MAMKDSLTLEDYEKCVRMCREQCSGNEPCTSTCVAGCSKLNQSFGSFGQLVADIVVSEIKGQLNRVGKKRN